MALNSRRGLDPRWTSHHTRTASGFMTAQIRIRRLGRDDTPVYDPDTKQYDYSDIGEIVFDGAARISPFGIFGDMLVGQDTTSRRLIRVQIETKHSGINVDDQIEIISAEGELPYFNIEVRGTIGSSMPWLTDLVCEADMKHRND